MDNITRKQRSEVMSKVSAKNTRPEVCVRRLLHKMGFRFGLHKKDLPGKPDICLTKYKTVIFVHGCFWHRHDKCKKTRLPKSNIDYWTAKFATNIKRDLQHKKDLKMLGWKVLIVWECELKKEDLLAKKLKRKIGYQLV